MTSVPKQIATWQMVQPASRNPDTGESVPGKLALVKIPVPGLKPGEVLVEISGCGVCQSDLDFFFDARPTVTRVPLTLGHEISGTVVAGETAWLGKEVLIAATIPCGQCPLCRTGRGHLCLSPAIPGNSYGIYGGYASHIPVPCSGLCEIKNRKTIPLEHLAAVADTVSTTFQAALKGALTAGDRVIVIGTGGMAPFMVQMARALGVKTVLAVNIEAAGLQKPPGDADALITPTGKTPEEMATEIKRIVAAKGLPAFGWKIFEASGTRSGRETALGLLGDAGKLILAGGSGAATVEYAMGLPVTGNAEIIGIQGCRPEDYPRVLDMVSSGKISLSPFVQTRPMSWIENVFLAAHATAPDKHIILTADDLGFEDSLELKSCR